MPRLTWSILVTLLYQAVTTHAFFLAPIDASARIVLRWGASIAELSVFLAPLGGASSEPWTDAEADPWGFIGGESTMLTHSNGIHALNSVVHLMRTASFIYYVEPSFKAPSCNQT